MTKKTEKTHFTLNFIKRQIIGSKASFQKASKGTGELYEELVRLMAQHPDFEIVEAEPKKKSNRAKRSYEGLDFAFMESYIEIQQDSDTLMTEYEEIKKTAKERSGKEYPTTKKWFIEKFGTKENGFDMNVAKEAITQYHFAVAKKLAVQSKGSENTSASNDVDVKAVD